MTIKNNISYNAACLEIENKYGAVAVQHSRNYQRTGFYKGCALVAIYDERTFKLILY